MNTIKNLLKNVLNLFKKQEKTEEIPDDFVIVDKFKSNCGDPDCTCCNGTCDCVKRKGHRERIESDESTLLDEKLIRTKKFKQKQRKRRNAYTSKKYD